MRENIVQQQAYHQQNYGDVDYQEAQYDFDPQNGFATNDEYHQNYYGNTTFEENDRHSSLQYDKPEKVGSVLARTQLYLNQAQQQAEQTYSNQAQGYGNRY